MSHLTNHISIVGVMLMICGLLVEGCHHNPTDSASVNKNILTSHSWKLQRLTVDGVDRTSLYSGMAITFTSTAYSSAGGAPVWPASGSWSFVSASATHIQRDDGVEISIDNINDSALQLSLTWTNTTYGGDRVNSVSGIHMYTFAK